jgi:ABC-2 type transport system ATP-binding protein
MQRAWHRIHAGLLARHEPRAADAGDAALVRVSGVRKRFGATVALDGLELAIAQGEILGLLGPNGAGKTTLLHILAGVARADEGSIVLRELGNPDQPAVRRAIGLAPQAPAVYPRLTAIENLRFFGRIYGLAGERLEQRVEWGLTFADLRARANQRVEGFSGGMLRRLSLACAAVHQPRLLLLDEPTSGVDPQSRNRVFEAITALREHGATIVYSTHLMSEAEELCTRIAIVDHGRLIAEGVPAQLLQRFACRDLQALFLALTGTEQRD